MQQPAEAVINALCRRKAVFLPRGELFIEKDFLDHFFPESDGEYVRQLETAAGRMGLSAMGVDLASEQVQPLLSSAQFAVLDRYFMMGYINGPVSRLAHDHGFLKALLILRNEPRVFSGMASGLLRQAKKRIEKALRNGFRAIVLADDIASNQGLLFSATCFRDTVWPVYKEVAGMIKEKGLFAFFHSDGDTRKIIDLLIAAGYDCIHPVDAQAGLDLRELRKDIGARVAFMGHIDAMAWDEERIRTEIDFAENSFRDGGLILGSSGGISMTTVNEGLSALYPFLKARGGNCQ